MTTRITLLLLSVVGCSEFSIEDKDDVVTNPLTVEESFLHQTEPRVDVLLVIDNTASMATEHQMLSEGLPLLVESLQTNAVSWPLGTITTDVTSSPEAMECSNR